MIDTTGSMGSSIEAVKAKATTIVNTLASTNRPVDFRVSVIDYKDFYANCASDGYAARVDLDFSTDTSAIVNALNSLSADGGCDTPESVYLGMMTAIGLHWRDGVSKEIIQMGDAPPHDPEPTTGYTKDTIVAAAKALDPAIIYPIDINGGGGPQIQALATETGGKVFTAETPDDITNAILSVIDEVSTPSNNPPVADAGQNQTVGCKGFRLDAAAVKGDAPATALRLYTA